MLDGVSFPIEIDVQGVGWGAACIFFFFFVYLKTSMLALADWNPFFPLLFSNLLWGWLFCVDVITPSSLR